MFQKRVYPYLWIIWTGNQWEGSELAKCYSLLITETFNRFHFNDAHTLRC